MNTFLIKTAFALAAGLIAGFLSQDIAVGSAIFAGALIIVWIPIYVKYANDNPQQLWFKRKLFGWGWTPVTWQGWLVIGIYVALMILFGLTIDESSPPNEVAFTFILPAVMLTVLFIRILYRKGEKPRWQWGKDIDKYQ